MLKIVGPRQNGFCDRLDRRSFLQIGSLALGGATLSLPQLLRAEQAAAASGQQSTRHKAVINIFLSGGPPHQDLVDLKPDAPSEIRGEFLPVATNVPGIQICELLPKLAAMTDKLAIIRSLIGSDGRHAAFQCQTGRRFANQIAGGWPSIGSNVSKLQGAVDPAVPPFVGLAPKMITSTWADPGQPGFLGPSHAPFLPNAEGKKDMVLNGVDSDRFGTRKSLLKNFDTLRRDVDASGMLRGMDKFTEQAFGILTSSKLAEAIDLEREDPKLRDRYGRGSDKPAGYGDAGPLNNDYFLLARRLVEAGVRVVTLAYGRWDWHGMPHGTNFSNAREHFPMLDIALSALIEDLERRDMLDTTTVLVWGEFGRTPKINPNGGRDHWPEVACAMLAGGGLRTGQIIGSTNRNAEHAKDRPVTFQEVFATLYHSLGIDVNTATINDLSGRPQYVIDGVQPIRELV
ncbi:MAG: DUF1501 domain-containing protein [Planctomycetaceae bacterium]|nr:DUF1501 domain-containing protein [Planctomycetaceae bacterium]